MATKKIEAAIEKSKKEEIKGNKHIVRIPMDPLNPKDVDVLVSINEKYAKIPRGEEVEVSEPIYEVLRNAGLV